MLKVRYIVKSVCIYIDIKKKKSNEKHSGKEKILFESNECGNSA
jgi:hypothetical protein